MAKVINCECGQVIRGDDEEELIVNAERHMKDAHPDLVGRVSREDLLAMADER
jgi:predicted small metal-binding protein